MTRDKKRSIPNDNGSRRSIPWGSYDTVPQPQGEFRDMFRLMQEQKAASGEKSTGIDEPSK